MRVLEWSASAIDDREEIFLHISRDNVDAAIELDQLLAAKAKILANHPEAGRIGRVPDTRELVAHRHYLLVYDLLPPNRIRILNVVHTSQRWPPIRIQKPPRRRRD